MTALRDMFVGITFQDNASRQLDAIDNRMDRISGGFVGLGSDISDTERGLSSFSRTGINSINRVGDSTSELSDVIEDARNDMQGFESTSIQAMGSIENSTEDLQASFNQVGGLINSTDSDLTDFGQSGSNALNHLGDGVNDLHGGLGNLSDASGGASESIINAMDDATGGLNDTEEEVVNLGDELDNAGNRGSSAGSKIASAFAGVALAGVIALGAGITTSVSNFVDFDNELRKAGAIAGASTEEFNAMKEAAIDMGSETSKNATEVAGSMAELAAKGFDANETISAMPGIIAASEASGESLAVAADTVASALNIWGLEAENSAHVADVLAQAANVSAAGIEDMQYAFKYAGAPAAALGIEMEEVASAIGIMTNAGLDGSGAGTTLRASLMALNNPAKEQQKMMDSLGMSMTDAEGNTKSLSGIIGELEDSTKGMTEAEKVATIGKLVGTEATSGMLSLMAAGPAEIDKMTTALENSGGSAQATADQMQGGIGGALESLGGTVDAFSLKIGDKLAPSIQTVATKLSEIDIDPIVDGFGVAVDTAIGFASSIIDNWGPIKETVIGLGTAVGSFALIMGGLRVMGVINTLMAAYRSGTLLATLAQMGLNTAMLMSPTTWVVAGIAALIAIGVLLYRNWDTVKEKAGLLWDKTKEVFGGIYDWGMNKIQPVIGFFKGLGDKFNDFKSAISNFKLPGWVTSIGGTLSNAASTVGGWLDGSHATGLASVPTNGYVAELHKNESVLTAQQSNALRSAGILTANSDGTPDLNMDTTKPEPIGIRYAETTKPITDKGLLNDPKILNFASLFKAKKPDSKRNDVSVDRENINPFSSVKNTTNNITNNNSAQTPNSKPSSISINAPITITVQSADNPKETARSIREELEEFFGDLIQANPLAREG